jgi:DNA-binding IclR family transcriptional regulator
VALDQPEDRGRDRTPPKTVASKVLSLLDVFTWESSELSLNELARRSGLPLSTTYRLAAELVDWGALERIAGGGYRLGMRLVEVGARAPRAASLNEVVAPFMQDLYVVTRENVHLAVLDGHEALYVERVTGRSSITVKSRRGGRMPLHATGVGKVLLAYAPEELVDELLRKGLERFTPYTIVAPGHLRRTLEDIRRTGFGIAREEMTVGRVSVAAPVHDASGQAVAAMSIVVRSGVDVAQLGPAVRTAAVSASRRLRERFPGHPPRPRTTSGPPPDPEQSKPSVPDSI